MSESNESSGGSNRQGGGRNNNRRRRKNPNNRSGNGSSGGNNKRRSGPPRSSGGARSGGVEFSKMPRRKAPPSLWQRFLGIFGLGGSKPKAKAKVSSKASRSDAKAGAAKTPRKKQAGAKKKVQRTPETVEVTTPRLYVGNLSYDAAESDLQELFTGVGTVSSVEVIYNARTQRSKGYAFVSMMSVDEAKRAVDELHDKEYMGRKMVVSGAKAPRKERDVA